MRKGTDPRSPSSLDGPQWLTVLLDGRVVVITGASRGLGLGMANWYVDKGARVGACARTEPGIVGELVLTRAVDVTDSEELESFAAEVSAQLGPIDLWINNAGVLEPLARQRSLEWEVLAANFAINVGGVLNGTRAFLARLAADRHRGALINVSSGLGDRGLAGTTAYSAAKAAVNRLTEVVALEELELLTIARAVSPGMVDTDMQALIRSQSEDVLPDRERFRRSSEQGTMNTPEWVAEVFAGWVFGVDAPPESIVTRVPPQPR